MLRTMDTGSPQSGPCVSGVNYAGFLGAGFGLGRAARGYIKALREMGFDVLPMDAGELLPGRSEREKGRLRAAMKNSGRLHPVSLVHINPDLLFTFWNEVGNGFFKNTYTIGIWAWETPSFPAKWHDRFALLDEIWVGGSFMAGGISLASPIPVIVMPHVVEPFIAEPERAAFGIHPDEYVFLYSFDAHSTYSRKNPMGVIRAFGLAFSPRESARLVLKSINSGNCPERYGELRDAAKGLRVTFLDEAMDEGRYAGLLASSDAFVSLHRAEGFGLGIAEAMAMAKPVIATGWSGNMDFMSAENSLPVGYELAGLTEADPPYEKGSLWAVPDLNDAASKMRFLFDNPSLGKAIGSIAKEQILGRNSPETVGRMIRERLAWVEPDRHRAGKRLPPETARMFTVKTAATLRMLLSVVLNRMPAGLTRTRAVLERARNRVSRTL